MTYFVSNPGINIILPVLNFLCKYGAGSSSKVTFKVKVFDQSLCTFTVAYLECAKGEAQGSGTEASQWGPGAKPL